MHGKYRLMNWPTLVLLLLTTPKGPPVTDISLETHAVHFSLTPLPRNEHIENLYNMNMFSHTVKACSKAPDGNVSKHQKSQAISKIMITKFKTNMYSEACCTRVYARVGGGGGALLGDFIVCTHTGHSSKTWHQ